MAAAALSPSSTPTGLRPERNLGIELLRGLLALCVLVFHYFYFGPILGLTPGVEPSGHWLAFGKYAVSAFFIISGYVISISAQDNTAVRFAVARFARLWPAIVVCATITYIAYLALDVEQRGFITWLRSASLLPLLWRGDYIDASYWSIGVELRFYALIALLVLASGVRYSLELITTLGAAFLIVYAYGDPGLSEYIHDMVYIGYFGLGIALYRVRFGEGLTPFVVFCGFVNFMLASTGTHIDFHAVDMFDGVRSSPLTGFAVAGAAFLLVLGAERIRLPAAVIPIAAFSGSISYPLYLLHQEFGYVIINLLTRMMPPLAAIAITVIIIIAISYAIFRFVEKPGTKRLRSTLNDGVERLTNGRTEALRLRDVKGSEKAP